MRDSPVRQIGLRAAQLISLAIGVAALVYGQLVLFCVALLSFGSASREYLRDRAHSLAQDFSVAEVMLDSAAFATINHGTRVYDAVVSALKTPQHYFPVRHQSQILGWISKDTLVKQTTRSSENEYVADCMEREFLCVEPEQSLASVLLQLNRRNPVAMVMKEGELVGMATHDNIVEFLLVQSALRSA